MFTKHIARTVLTTAIVAPLAWSALTPASAPAPAAAWEYEVVSLAAFHGNPFEALKDAFGGAADDEDVGLFEAALRADARQAEKREAFLNGYGSEGWELLDWGLKTATFKRPAR